MSPSTGSRPPSRTSRCSCVAVVHRGARVRAAHRHRGLTGRPVDRGGSPGVERRPGAAPARQRGPTRGVAAYVRCPARPGHGAGGRGDLAQRGARPDGRGCRDVPVRRPRRQQAGLPAGRGTRLNQQDPPTATEHEHGGTTTPGHHVHGSTGRGPTIRHVDVCPAARIGRDLRDPRPGQGRGHHRRPPVHRGVHGPGRWHPRAPRDRRHPDGHQQDRRRRDRGPPDRTPELTSR